MIKACQALLECKHLKFALKTFVQPHFDYCDIAWYGRFKDDCNDLDATQKLCILCNILGVDFLTPSVDIITPGQKNPSNHKSYLTWL